MWTSYTVVVKGELSPTQSKTRTMLLNVVVPCYFNVITPKNQTYSINRNALKVKVLKFTTTQQTYCPSLPYTITMNGTRLDANILSVVS
jgi:hypothetical protein